MQPSGKWDGRSCILELILVAEKQLWSPLILARWLWIYCALSLVLIYFIIRHCGVWNSPFFSFFRGWGETSNYKESFGGAPLLSLSRPISSALQHSIIVVSEAALSGVWVIRQPSPSSLPTFLTSNSNLLCAINEEGSIRGPCIDRRFWCPYWCHK